MQGLREVFEKLGNVEDVNFIGHGDSCGRPAAIVRMETADSAADAVEKLNFKQGSKEDILVRFKHPSRGARERLKLAAGLTGHNADDDYYPDYD